MRHSDNSVICKVSRAIVPLSLSLEMVEILRVLAWVTRDQTIGGLVVWQVPLISVWVFRPSLHMQRVLADDLSTLAS